MRKFIKKCIKIMKLTVLWFLRILFAKNHFKVPFWEKLRCNIFGGYLADQYVIYDFKHNDRKQYLSEFDWYRSRYINEPFNFIMNNKIACTEILKHYVKVPEIYAIKNKGDISSYEYKVRSNEDAWKLLQEKKSLFIKPMGAGKGKGVSILKYEEGQLYVDDEAYTKEQFFDLLGSMENWFLSETIRQHPYLDQLYDKTTNTIRMITMKDIHTKEFRIFFAVQRIGTKQTIPVDNGSRGGLVSKIDLETGTLSEACSLHSLDVHKVHPDSGNPIEGVVIPGWEKIKSDVLKLVNHFPFMHFIAWDILLTEEGICIIEANTSSGVNIIQRWGPQRYGELGEFYRYHKIIK